MKNNNNFGYPSAPLAIENPGDLRTGNYIKLPIFLVKDADLNNLTNGVTTIFNLYPISDTGNYKIAPVISGRSGLLYDDILQNGNSSLEMLYSSSKGNNFVVVNSNTNTLTINKDVVNLLIDDLPLFVFSSNIVSSNTPYIVSINQ